MGMPTSCTLYLDGVRGCDLQSERVTVWDAWSGGATGYATQLVRVAGWDVYLGEAVLSNQARLQAGLCSQRVPYAVRGCP